MMKFSLKMTLCILIILAFFLSINGYLMIEKNFETVLSTVSEQNAARHQNDVSQIESEAAARLTEALKYANMDIISMYDYEMSAVLDRTLQKACIILEEQVNTDMRGFAVMLQNGSSFFTVMPDDVSKNTQIAALTIEEGKYRVLKTESGKSFMLMNSPLMVNGQDANFISAYDISRIFASRDAQLDNLTKLTGLTLIVGVVIVSALSVYLTRPLKKLKKASENIAAGDYSGRTSIRTSDEIEALSVSFDKMAAAVEDKVLSLNRTLSARERFIGAFTHELKTPMTSMLGYAAFLREGEQSPEEQRIAADYIYRETRRLEQLSGKLMLLLGLKEEKIELVSSSLNVIFANIKKTPPKVRRNVQLEFKSKKNILVLCDKVLIGDMLRNLIVNGMRACSDGGTVRVTSGIVDGEAIVSVTDNGCGIPQSEISRITEPFYMVDKSRAREDNGSGMGLALCVKIAELHETNLVFESQVSIGTTVSFRLKLAKGVCDNEEQ
ncbi:MAG: HAMP domain-containing sensor histidine kinase [Oscillospiraceae bacterium]